MQTFEKTFLAGHKFKTIVTRQIGTFLFLSQTHREHEHGSFQSNTGNEKEPGIVILDSGCM